MPNYDIAHVLCLIELEVGLVQLEVPVVPLLWEALVLEQVPFFLLQTRTGGSLG